MGLLCFSSLSWVSCGFNFSPSKHPPDNQTPTDTSPPTHTLTPSGWDTCIHVLTWFNCNRQFKNIFIITQQTLLLSKIKVPSLSKCPSSISSRMLNGVIWMSSSKSIVGSSWPVKTQEEQTFPMAKLKLKIKQHEHVNLMCVHVNCNYNNVKFTGASNSRDTVLSLVYMCINWFNERERKK